MAKRGRRDINQKAFIDAISIVYERIGELYKTGAFYDKKPGSDVWCISTEHRQRMFRMVKEKYLELTKYPKEEFPFSEDYVAFEWNRCRKERTGPDRTTEETEDEPAVGNALFV